MIKVKYNGNWIDYEVWKRDFKPLVSPKVAKKHKEAMDKATSEMTDESWMKHQERQFAKRNKQREIDSVMAGQPMTPAEAYKPEEVVEITKVPPMTQEQSDKFIADWVAAAKEPNIELIDDVE